MSKSPRNCFLTQLKQGNHLENLKESDVFTEFILVLVYKPKKVLTVSIKKPNKLFFDWYYTYLIKIVEDV